MLKNKVDKGYMCMITFLGIAFAVELVGNVYGEFTPVGFAQAFCFAGLLFCFGSYIEHGNTPRKRNEDCFLSGVICLGFSLLFWVTIWVDLLWGDR